jgi:hypothetical protein
MTHPHTVLVLLALDHSEHLNPVARAELYSAAQEILNPHDHTLAEAAGAVARSLQEAESCQLLFSRLTSRPA